MDDFVYIGGILKCKVRDSIDRIPVHDANPTLSGELTFVGTHVLDASSSCLGFVDKIARGNAIWRRIRWGRTAVKHVPRSFHGSSRKWAISRDVARDVALECFQIFIGVDFHFLRAVASLGLDIQFAGSSLQCDLCLRCTHTLLHDLDVGLGCLQTSRAI